ncbi:hypothetical protein LJC07_04745 [Christensenellaceae bacterium OttesenSCG-928-L17]|nr:hypothetical protein [Christensenellaceae bacterium OttesenSCG-928-L17]
MEDTNITDQIAEIEKNVLVINKTAVEDELLTYVVGETVDRVLRYLNRKDLPNDLLKIIARIASGVYNQTNANVTNDGADTAISSISDNGQSISYADKTKNYLASVDDGEIFAGFTKLLAPYRRVNVHSK